MNIRNLLPGFIKKIIRFFYYKNERKKVFREIKIIKQQNEHIKKNYDRNVEKLIVFVVFGSDWYTGTDNISGGILSISSIYEETNKLKKIHNANVIMLTHANAHLLRKHTQFPNNINVYRFKQLYKYFKRIDSVLFHVPECIVPQFRLQLLAFSKKLLHIKQLRVNILNQNITLMPPVEEIQAMKKHIPLITQTTAHEKYSTPDIERKYGIPLYKLSVFADSSRYKKTPFEKKENIIAISPDEHPLKQAILERIKKELPFLEIRIIKNMKYLAYLDLISRCKYTLTLGEGLDFYFIETVFSGGISFTCYNSSFFPDSFKNSVGIFNDAESLYNNIVESVKQFNNKKDYSNVNNKQNKMISPLYKYDEYLKNLSYFYQNIYNK